MSGAASYDFNSTATITATPSTGYLFSGWSGSTSSDLNVSVNMSQIKKSMPPLCRTPRIPMGTVEQLRGTGHALDDPNDSTSDDDSLTDGEEVPIGLDPNAAITALMTFNNRNPPPGVTETPAELPGCRQILGPIIIHPSRGQCLQCDPLCQWSE